MKLAGMIAALGLGLTLAGCLRPDTSLLNEGSVDTSQPAILTQGVGLQTQSQRTYNDGDPWPFRIVSIGMATLVLTLSYTIRRLGSSRPVNGH